MFDIAAPFCTLGGGADPGISRVSALAVRSRAENRSDITVRFVIIS